MMVTYDQTSIPKEHFDQLDGARCEVFCFGVSAVYEAILTEAHKALTGRERDVFNYAYQAIDLHFRELRKKGSSCIFCDQLIPGWPAVVGVAVPLKDVIFDGSRRGVAVLICEACVPDTEEECRLKVGQALGRIVPQAPGSATSQ
jgi:hypothetical protein